LRCLSADSGKILQRRSLPARYFAEGLARVDNQLVQLTWRHGLAFRYNEDWDSLGVFKYSGEGWGLTSVGRELLRSDGSPRLVFHRNSDFREVRALEVRAGGLPVAGLNELEYARGEIFANVFTRDFILRISPEDGQISGVVDCSELRRQLPGNQRVDVLNGIAWDEAKDLFYLTGKYWPLIFVVRLETVVP